jgi:hypothetical protein
MLLDFGELGKSTERTAPTPTFGGWKGHDAESAADFAPRRIFGHTVGGNASVYDSVLPPLPPLLEPELVELLDGLLGVDGALALVLDGVDEDAGVGELVLESFFTEP